MDATGYREGLLEARQGALFFREGAPGEDAPVLTLEPGTMVSLLALDAGWQTLRLEIDPDLGCPTYFYGGQSHALKDAGEGRVRIGRVFYALDQGAFTFDDLKGCVRRAAQEGWRHAFLTGDFYDEIVHLGACCSPALLPEDHLRIESIVSGPLSPDLAPEQIQKIAMAFLTRIRDGLSGLDRVVYLSRERLKQLQRDGLGRLTPPGGS